MDYFDFLEEIVQIKYNCVSKTGKKAAKILVPSQSAKILGIEDFIEILGIRIEIVESQEGAIKVLLG